MGEIPEIKQKPPIFYIILLALAVGVLALPFLADLYVLNVLNLFMVHINTTKKNLKRKRGAKNALVGCFGHTFGKTECFAAQGKARRSAD